MTRNELLREFLSFRYGADDPADDPADLLARDGGVCEALVREKLLVAREILLRDLSGELQVQPVLSSPQAVRDWLRLKCADLEHEVFFLLHLNVRNHLIEAQELFRGTLTHTSVYPREVVKAALGRNAASVILAHNHPSGHAQPSQADQALTQHLASALGLVDVKVIDHFIVAGESIVSFAEQGLL